MLLNEVKKLKIKLTEVDSKGNEIETTSIKINLTKKELKEYQKLYCECNYLEKHQEELPEYVENYNGVSHGWICPKCKKFIQIG